MKLDLKTIMKCLTGIMVNAFLGAVIAGVCGVPAWTGIVVAIVIALFIGKFLPTDSLNAGVLTEIWTGELIKALRAGINATWLDGIPDYSRYAENDVIHLIDVGGDPDVLINNTTYPIPIQDINDSDVAISLDKYQTKGTRVTDDEMYASSYDKMTSLKERHAMAILVNKFKKAIHALAPQNNTNKTPVILTSGENDNGRRRITIKDIIALKDKFDKMEVPTDGRRLVLCSDHVNDLLLSDQKFATQYYNYTTGKIANLYGFEVYEYVSCPYFTTAGAKKSFSATVGSTDRQASVAFYLQRMFKASGSTKMYYSEAAKSPQTQENLVNFRHYFIVLPKKQEAIGAIASASYTPSISVEPATLNFAKEGGTKQVAVSASSDYAYTTPEGFSIVKQNNVLLITATDNSAGSAAKTGTITLTLAEDVSKTATITLNQPKA